MPFRGFIFRYAWRNSSARLVRIDSTGASTPSSSDSGRSNQRQQRRERLMAPGARRTGPQKGGRKGDVYRIGGVDLPWDPELDLDAPRPTPLQPESKTKPPKPLSTKEKSEVSHLLIIRDNIRRGPLYTVLGGNSRVSKPGFSKTSAAATFDAFNGMPSYSSRYVPKKHALPQLHTRPFVKEFFPRELWSTIDPDYKENGNGDATGKNNARGKSLQIPGYEKAEHLEMFDNQLDDDDEGLEGPAKEPADEDAAEEEVDEEFDEEDEGGDYNAEMYFDDGGDDVGEDYDGGDDGGIDYF